MITGMFENRCPVPCEMDQSTPLEIATTIAVTVAFLAKTSVSMESPRRSRIQTHGSRGAHMIWPSRLDCPDSPTQGGSRFSITLTGSASSAATSSSPRLSIRRAANSWTIGTTIGIRSSNLSMHLTSWTL